MLSLFNTLTRRVESFKPIDDKKVKMYTCGPSTYQGRHIGNYRTFLFEDVLQRYLEYSGYEVTRLMTLTDVEDKALAQATKRKRFGRRINPAERGCSLPRLWFLQNQ